MKTLAMAVLITCAIPGLFLAFAMAVSTPSTDKILLHVFDRLPSGILYTIGVSKDHVGSGFSVGIRPIGPSLLILLATFLYFTGVWLCWKKMN
jgi:hypothetical protein